MPRSLPQHALSFIEPLCLQSPCREPLDLPFADRSLVGAPSTFLGASKKFWFRPFLWHKLVVDPSFPAAPNKLTLVHQLGEQPLGLLDYQSDTAPPLLAA